MPYKSMAQSRFMHARKPSLAEKWDKEGGTDWKHLPKKKKKKGLAEK